MTAVFETMRATTLDGALRIALLPWHLERLARSVRSLGGTAFDLAAVERALGDLRSVDPATFILRVTASIRGGAVELGVERRPLVAPPRPLRLLPIEDLPTLVSGRRDLKLAERGGWEAAEQRARAAGADEVLTLRADGTVGETSRGNLFAQVGDRFVTPPADGTLLPGVARTVLLHRLRRIGAAVDERPVRVEELDRARLWSTNAVHGPRPAALVGGEFAPSGPDPLAALW